MDRSTIRSTKEIMRCILHRAFQENRGAEAILLIQWRRAAVHSRNINEEVARLNMFERNYHGQPQSVRMINTLAQRANAFIRYLDPTVDGTKFLDNPKLN